MAGSSPERPRDENRLRKDVSRERNVQAAPETPDRIIGWREWVKLPGLGIDRIKAKVDTGARSSCIHAIDVKVIEKGGLRVVRFKVHPQQRDSKTTVDCEAELLEYREIRSSTGHMQLRPVIVTTIDVMGESWPIELTLANRDEMGFRMLLGRQGIRHRFLVDTARSFYGDNLNEAET